MSIHDAETAREKQEQRIAEKHTKEADARPDPMHRAVHFLLLQAKANNRDCSREANYHIESLDAKLGEPKKLEEVGEQIPDADPVETAAETAQAENTAAQSSRAAATRPPNTAKALRTSKRFQRNT